MKSQLMKYSVMFVLLLVALSYSQLSFAQLQNSVELSYDECQKQILDQMNKTVSSIDKSKAILLAQSSPEFLAKVTKLKHTFSGIFTNMTWNDSTCGDVKLKDVTVQFSVLDEQGVFEKFVQVDEDPDLDRVIRIRDIFVETCDNNCPPPGPPPFDVQEDTGSDIIRAQCLDGTQFLRQGKVDVIQLGDEGKFYVNKDTKIVSSILHKDAKPQTVHLRLEITNPQQGIKLNQTKQIMFDDCPSRAIVEWHFTPKVSGKHQVKLKELESGSGYSTNIEVKDLDKIEFIEGKLFFVSEKYKITHNPSETIMFHGVSFTHPAFPDPPAPGGGAFTDVTFQDGTQETLSNVGLLKSPILFTKHIDPQAGMRENTYDTFSILVSANLTKISPLQQFKSGLAPADVVCKSDLVLVMKMTDSSPACVKPEHSGRLLSNGWFSVHPSDRAKRPLVTVIESSKDLGIGLTEMQVMSKQSYDAFHDGNLKIPAFQGVLSETPTVISKITNVNNQTIVLNQVLITGSIILSPGSTATIMYADAIGCSVSHLEDGKTTCPYPSAIYDPVQLSPNESFVSYFSDDFTHKLGPIDKITVSIWYSMGADAQQYRTEIDYALDIENEN